MTTAQIGERVVELPPDFVTRYRSTLGLCVGFRSTLASAIIVVSCRRDDPERTLYVTYEWELPELNVDTIAAELAAARKRFRTVVTFGYYGGRDENTVFKTLSIRLGQHVSPPPHDHAAPTTLVIDDLRSGRLKTRPGSLVARDAALALWRGGSPDETGILVALRCAHWGAQQYRQKRAPAPRSGSAAAGALKERRRRQERPF